MLILERVEPDLASLDPTQAICSACSWESERGLSNYAKDERPGQVALRRKPCTSERGRGKEARRVGRSIHSPALSVRARPGRCGDVYFQCQAGRDPANVVRQLRSEHTHVRARYTPEGQIAGRKLPETPITEQHRPDLTPGSPTVS